MHPAQAVRRAFVVREVADAADIANVRRLVTAHGDARATIPGVETVYADAARMPGPYVAPRGGIWLAVAVAVTVADGEGVGCVALRPLGARVAEVKRMFVDAEWRGRGVGRALLVALIKGARTRGYASLRLGTLDDMNAAQHLYRSLGYTPIERYRPDALMDTQFYELSLE